MKTSRNFNRLEVCAANSFYNTHAIDVTYNLGMLRRGNCPMPGTVVAELPNAPAVLGQRLLDRSHREGKEMQFLLTEDALVVRFIGFVARMTWNGGPLSYPGNSTGGNRMESVVEYTDLVAKLVRDIAQLVLALTAVALCWTGKAFRLVHQTPHEGKKRSAGLAFWWRLVEPDPGSKKSSELTIAGIMWNTNGGGSFHIGKHVFNLMPGMPQEHGHLTYKFCIFFNRPSDLTKIRRN